MFDGPESLWPPAGQKRPTDDITDGNPRMKRSRGMYHDPLEAAHGMAAPVYTTPDATQLSVESSFYTVSGNPLLLSHPTTTFQPDIEPCFATAEYVLAEDAIPLSAAVVPTETTWDNTSVWSSDPATAAFSRPWISETGYGVCEFGEQSQNSASIVPPSSTEQAERSFFRPLHTSSLPESGIITESTACVQPLAIAGGIATQDLISPPVPVSDSVEPLASASISPLPTSPQSCSTLCLYGTRPVSGKLVLCSIAQNPSH